MRICLVAQRRKRRAKGVGGGSRRAAPSSNDVECGGHATAAFGSGGHACARGGRHGRPYGKAAAAWPHALHSDRDEDRDLLRWIRILRRAASHGRMANARAGNPNPFLTFGQVTTM